MTRIILLGASNLTVGFPAVITNLRARLDGPLEIFGACGHGRSYGTWSRVLVRSLPGICECGLWEAVSRESRVESREQSESSASAHNRANPRLSTLNSEPEPLALVTDIGNDLLYGATPEQIAGWVQTCLERLAAQRAETVLTLLPMASLRRLSNWRYHLTRLLFFPGRGLSWPVMRARAEELNERLAGLAQEACDSGASVHLVEQPGAWYGFDPIHFRLSRRREAWRDILSRWPAFGGAEPLERPSLSDRFRFGHLRPAERRLFGITRRTAQPVLEENTLRIALY